MNSPWRGFWLLKCRCSYLHGESTQSRNGRQALWIWLLCSSPSFSSSSFSLPHGFCQCKSWSFCYLEREYSMGVVLTATFTVGNPDRVTSRSVSASLTVKGWPHFFRHRLAKPQSDLTQQFHAKAWSGMWGGATRHFLTCSPFYVCQLICVSLMMFL